MYKSYQIIIRKKEKVRRKRLRFYCISSKELRRNKSYKDMEKLQKYSKNSPLVYPKLTEINHQPILEIKPLKFWKKAKEGTVEKFSGILLKENKNISIISEEDLDNIFNNIRKR